MNKIIIISAMMMVFFVPIALGEAVSVSRNMPDRVDPNGALTVSFSISPSETLKGFDLADLIPLNWAISDWSVTGFNKADITFDSKTQSYLGSSYAANHWKFNKNLTSPATVTYTISVPVSSGSYDFVGIWTYPGGFNSDKKTLSVATAVTAPTACPTCAECTEWSECIDNQQTRTCYKCSADTSYECQASPETKTCEQIKLNWMLYVGIIAGVVLLIILLLILRKKSHKHNEHHIMNHNHHTEG